MNIKKKLTMMIAITAIVANCTYLPGINTVKGSVAKAQITDAMTTVGMTNAFLAISLFSSLCASSVPTFYPDVDTCLLAMGINTGTLVTSAMVTNDIFADIFVSIDDNKMYTKSSVDNCVAAINSAGYIVGTIIAAACNLEEASLIQVGDIGVP